MKRWSAFVLLAALAVPATAAAQRKPSRSMQVRSAEVYLDRAKNTGVGEERDELLRKALEVLTDGAQRDADNPLVWLMMGQANARLGDVAGADSAFDRAESLYPEYTQEIAPERFAVWVEEYNAGIAAIQAGDPAGAIGRFELADRIFRGRPDASVTLGSLYAQMGELAKAEAAYRNAIEIARGPAAATVPPDEKEQWAQQEETSAMRLADLLNQLGRKDEAVAVYRGLAENQPANARARAGLASQLAMAGRNDEAAAIYERLLGSNDLSDIEWFNAGVGLYTANNHALAVRAFEKSLEINPYSRDAIYNHGQALYASAAELEKARAAAPEAGKAAITQQLEALYLELGETAAEIRAMDPNNRNAYMMQAQAQRSLGELAGDPAKLKEWQNKVLATLELVEAMPFEVSPVDVRVSETGVSVSGGITNLKLTPGQAIALEFTLIGEAGDVVATRAVSVPAPAVDEKASFGFDVATDKTVLGWRYKVTG